METQEKQEFELPPVVDGTAVEIGQTNQETAEAIKLEQAQSTQQVPLGGAVSVQTITPSADPATVSPQATIAIGSAVLSDLPAVADDIDLIEKEWVEKAKHVVQATIGDPYNQNKQINKIKADYIKKRYNRDIRTNE